MPHIWVLEESGNEVDAADVEQMLITRIESGHLWSCFVSDAGHRLMVAANGERAMVVLLHHDGEAGEHMVDPDAPGESTGFVLDNGQVDTYSNADTVPVARAAVGVQGVLADDDRAAGWHNDR